MADVKSSLDIPNQASFPIWYMILVTCKHLNTPACMPVCMPACTHAPTRPQAHPHTFACELSFEELVTLLGVETQFFTDADSTTQAMQYRLNMNTQCQVQSESARVGRKLLIFRREWTRRLLNLDEVCRTAEALHYEVEILRIRGLQPCEKIRHTNKADVILLADGSDYIFAAMARPGTVIIHFGPFSSRWPDSKLLYNLMGVHSLEWLDFGESLVCDGECADMSQSYGRYWSRRQYRDLYLEPKVLESFLHEAQRLLGGSVARSCAAVLPHTVPEYLVHGIDLEHESFALCDTGGVAVVDRQTFLDQRFQTWNLEVQGAKHYNWEVCEPLETENSPCGSDKDQAGCAFAWNANSFLNGHVMQAWIRGGRHLPQLPYSWNLTAALLSALPHASQHTQSPPFRLQTDPMDTSSLHAGRQHCLSYFSVAEGAECFFHAMKALLTRCANGPFGGKDPNGTEFSVLVD